MMSFLDANKGAHAPKLRLSRKGLVLCSAAAAALIVSLYAGWNINAVAAENETLRATIKTMEQKALAEKASDPKEQRIAELDAKLQALQQDAQRFMVGSDALVQSAAAMPEFKSPQYKEPFQVLLKQIHELNALAQIAKSEGAQ
jgi:hypothetical protein